MYCSVYILYSETLNRYYVGSTNNVEGRLERHLANHRGYTARAKDWTVRYTEEYATKSEAVKREMQIKSWKSRVLIEKLIAGR